MRNPLHSMKIRPLQYGAYDPVSNTYGNVRRHRTRTHQGWDLLAPVGTPVFAITDGELTSGHSQSYGNWLSLKFMHRGNPHYAFYAHLQNILQRDCSIVEGSLIATSGRSGNAMQIPHAEAHLHFEIRTVEHPNLALHGRIDPGEALGYRIYSCSPDSVPFARI